MFKVESHQNDVNFEHISHLCSSVSIVNFDQVNAGWVDGQRGFLRNTFGKVLVGTPSYFSK